MKNIFDLRRDFTLKTLDESEVDTNPIYQFEKWFNEAIDSEVLEPNAMVLSTVSKNLQPYSRTLLLKQIKEEGFVFFTNYDSDKAIQIKENPRVSLIFIWHELERQVRIEGVAEKISAVDSDSYFERRPIGSKLGAWASPQSKIIPNRQYLEGLVNDFEHKFKDQEITRPANWGGYIVKPSSFEFWQGRKSRLHDRIKYTQLSDKNAWKIVRLAP